ncbi:Slc7a6os family protein [Megaselia abdita]
MAKSLPVVRVKRRLTEEPLAAFVLNCKKPKLDESNNLEEEQKDEISAILKFAGTVENQNTPIAEHITRLTKDDAKQLAQKSRNPNITEKSRQEMRQSLQESRFKVVNCHRSFEPNAESISNPKEITIVDIEKQKGVNTHNENENENTETPQESFVPTDGDAGDGFVYDLYVPDHDQQLPDNVDYMEPYISVRPFDDLTLEDCYTNEDEDYDSEDSNQENYFANDYPEEDDYFSVDEEDIVKAVARCDLNSDNELSSDDEEVNSNSENFILSVYDNDHHREEEDDDYYDFSDDERDDYGRRRIHYVDENDEENEEYF